jgi:3',5'-nucleoside bisphosphate phosphatase
MVDLHTHSFYSDGTHSPAQLVEKAESLSMKAIAITDHDTTDGLEEGIAAAKGKKVKFIPGIELSVTHNPGELHILGLGLKKWDNSPILNIINEKRKARNIKIIEIMNNQGLDITYEDLRKQTKGTIGRPHFASWLLSRTYVSNIKEAFTKFLIKGKPFYIPRETISLEEAIDFIHNSGAYAFVAHPLNIPVNFTVLLEKLDYFLSLGIDGIEAIHSGSKRNMTKRLVTYGEKKSCLISGGSDFHGMNKPHIKMGKTKGFGSISDIFLPDILS